MHTATDNDLQLVMLPLFWFMVHGLLKEIFLDHATGTVFLNNMGVQCNKKSELCDIRSALYDMRSALCDMLWGYAIRVHYIIWVCFDNIPM